MPAQPKRLLFLFSDTGGGHRAAAQSICEALRQQYSTDRVQGIVQDTWAKLGPPPLRNLPALYPWLVGPAQPLWRTLWHLSDRWPLHRLWFGVAASLTRQRMARYLRQLQPDVLVSVHPFYNHLGRVWLKAAGLGIPLITIVTDLVSVHRSWICPDVTHCFVSTTQARQRAIQLGLSPGQVTVAGHPVHPTFARLAKQAPAKAAQRHQLGLRAELPVVLLIAGGEGTGHVPAVAQAVAQRLAESGLAQLVIIAGRNQRLKDKLTAHRWPCPTRICGFVDDMPQWLAATEILITKAGPGTLSEAFILGLPPLIFSHIPGQETANISYVQAHHAGIALSEPPAIAHQIHHWLTHPTEYARYRHRARQLARPHAAPFLAESLARWAGV